MRIASGLVKGHHVLTVTIFLIVAVLVVGAAACDGAGTYQLTISSTSGGNVTTPGEATFPYPAGTLVQLVAVPDDGYEFRSWSGDIEHIANPNAASTAITMNGNYAIVANFQTDGGTSPGNGGHTQP
jgi:hypothetical protein